MGNEQKTMAPPPNVMRRRLSCPSIAVLEPASESSSRSPARLGKMSQLRLRERYVIEKNLGMGAFGVVNYARDKSDLAKEVAVKTVRVDKVADMPPAQSKKVFERMHEEVRIQMRCKHRHIVKVIESFVVDKKVEAFVTEYCSGGSLADRVKTTKSNEDWLSEEIVARWMIHLMDALALVHSLNIIHRDVKMDNCLLSSPDEEVLKLSDFGVACELSGGKVMKQRVGTPFYMAPEVVAGTSYNTKVDCWSAGVTLLYMLDACTPLFNGEQLSADSPPSLAELRWADNAPSSQALLFLESLLKHSPYARSSATMAAGHPFLEIGRNSPRLARNENYNATFNTMEIWSPHATSHFSQRSQQRSQRCLSMEEEHPGYPKRVMRRRSLSTPQCLFLNPETMPSFQELQASWAQEQKSAASSIALPSLPNDNNTLKYGMHKPEQHTSEELVIIEKDVEKIGDLIAIFNERNSARLNLQECQNMFSAANPATSEKAAYPTKKQYKARAADPQAGLTAMEIYFLIDCSSAYLAKLIIKIQKWRAMTNETRQQKISEKRRKSRVFTYPMMEQIIDQE